MAYSDRELLARLIQCEAGGEGESGMKAVAGVVMNRVHARGGEYARVGQGSIRNIIFQPYQFACASETENGAYNPHNLQVPDDALIVQFHPHLLRANPTGPKRICHLPFSSFPSNSTFTLAYSPRKRKPLLILS